MANRLLLILAASLLSFTAGAAGASPVEVGQKAPDFVTDSTQGPIRLSDYQGKKNVVLAFYLKDFTPG